MGMSKLACLSALLGQITLGARVKRVNQKSGAKLIAGVPVLNYHLAASEDSIQNGGEQDWVLVVKPFVTDAEVNKMCKELKCVREGHPQEGGVPFFEVRSSEKSLESLLVASGSMIKFVERDTMKYMVPEFEAQASASWGLDKIGAPTRKFTGKGSNVYVVDTGIKVTHNDYGGRASSAIDMTSDSLVECGGSKDCAADRQGHGSHCAGTAAGTTYGVAPEASIYAVKTLSDEGGGPWSWDYEALDWLARKAIRPAVVSMSLGGGGVLQAYKEAADSAVAAGLVIVVAGGNDNDDACDYTPAFIPSVITVGSTDSKDRRSGFSNYGSCVQIWAPGTDITSVGLASNSASQTYSGTSMACPHVSGATALLLQEGIAAKDVEATLLARSAQNRISGLYAPDVNRLLWVGAGDATDGNEGPGDKIPDVCDSSTCTGRWGCYRGECQKCAQCQ